MYNIYENSRGSDQYRKLECDGALFVEFRCIPGKDDVYDVCSQHASIIYVTSGKKRWITPEGDITARKGEAMFCKKGIFKMKNFYEEDFCALLFFLPEAFIRDTVLEFQENLVHYKPCYEDFAVTKMTINESLHTYFNSVVCNLFQNNNPSKLILKLKFKELILQILTSDENPLLSASLISGLHEEKINIKRIMEQNLLANISLEEYARLCSRSLSSFKRDFQEIFGTSPGKWLTENRLKYSRMKLLNTNNNINDVAFESGFETTSHFIRSFRKQYGLPPLQFRQQHYARNEEHLKLLSNEESG